MAGLAWPRKHARIERAVRVTAVEIYVDADTLDRIFIVHSESQEPISLRVSPVELPVILADLAEAISKSMN